MNAESFADAKTASFLNENFVCIKVDREERPDVDHVYMAAVQALTGNGGWPLTAFLLPDGRPFFGGTYYPPKDRVGPDGKLLMPGFDRVLATMKMLYDTKRADVEKQAASLTEFLKRQADAPTLQQHAIDARLLSDSVRLIAESFDRDEGGLGYPPDYAPKFPQPSVAIYLLAMAEGKDDAAVKLARQQGDAMAAGGVHDQVGGGFHRYSVDRAWLVPHFEKMLYDQAQLLSLYAGLYQLEPNERDADVIDGIVSFLRREMQLENGLFRAALDADSEHEEGKFYVWTSDELKSVLGADAAWGMNLLGTTGAPNFEGKYILTMKQPFTDAASKQRWQAIQQKLLAAREKRVRPAADTKAITSWNALLVIGLVDAALATNNASYRALAVSTMNALLEHARKPDGTLYRQVTEGKGKGDGYADDYAAMILALVRSFDLTQQPEYLEQAKGLTQQLLDRFRDQTGRGFLYVDRESKSLFVPFKETYDGAVPSANGMSALAFVRLAKVTGDKSYLKPAGEVLAYVSKEMAESPTNASVSLLAAKEYLHQGGTAGLAAPRDAKGSGNIVTVAGPSAPLAVNRRGTTTFEVVVTIQKGWHINANPAQPDYLKPTVLSTAKDSPVRIAKVGYPEGAESKAGGLETPIRAYEGEIRLPVSIEVTKDAKPGAQELSFELEFQACDDQRCLAPARLPVTIPATIE
jgi:uncharacterized protein YyaL (SSP411 family)